MAISRTPSIGLTQRRVTEQNIASGTAPDPNRRIRTTENPYDPSLYDVQFRNTPGFGAGSTNDNLYSADPNVRLAQTYLNQYYAGGGRVKGMPGTYKNYEEQANKVALKRALAQGITDAPKQLQEELGLLRGDAAGALESSLGQTRRNFNRRGLLYSGLRQAGESQVRGRVASTLARSEAEARRETQNVLDKRKAAFAAIGLADQEAKNREAQAAFEMSYRNSIARQQALQELSGGIGQGLGYYFGSRQDTPKTDQDTPMAGGSYRDVSGVA